MRNSQVLLVSSPLNLTDCKPDQDRTSKLIGAICGVLNAQCVGWSASDDDNRPRGAEPNGARDPAIQQVGLNKRETALLRDHVDKRMLWPVFYGRPDLIQFDAAAYKVYQDLNERMAAYLQPMLTETDCDIVWVHDYMHVPLADALRRHGADGALGCLFHAPFPTLEQIAAFPRHADLLNQICAFDVVGFQSDACRRHFEMAAQRYAGASLRPGGLKGPFGSLQTRVHQLPGQWRKVDRLAQSPEVEGMAAQLRTHTAGRSLIASFATLDPSQAVLEGLRSFEILLDTKPDWRGRTMMVQATMHPSGWLLEDAAFRTTVEQSYTNINGSFATLDWTPILYFHEPLDTVRLTALYRDTSVGLITPFCEGVSLIAKDFVASQDPNDPAVLILSKLVATSTSLDGALLVNPHDSYETMEALCRGLEMPGDERMARWQTMKQVLEGEDLVSWCHAVVNELADVSSTRAAMPVTSVGAPSGSPPPVTASTLTG